MTNSTDAKPIDTAATLVALLEIGEVAIRRMEGRYVVICGNVFVGSVDEDPQAGDTFKPFDLACAIETLLQTVLDERRLQKKLDLLVKPPTFCPPNLGSSSPATPARS